MPAISVIVPVYNVEKYLHRCIDSILNQTYSDFELILIDDGSTDSSGDICDEYSKLDNRVVVIHQENKGVSSARNTGIMTACGEWIHWVDSDDVIHPQMLELLISIAEKTQTDLCMCSRVTGNNPDDSFFVPYNTPVFSIHCTHDEQEDLYYRNVTGMYWVVWAKLIKRSIVTQYLFQEGRCYEDNPIVIQWLYCAEKVAVIDFPLYFYRLNDCSITKSAFSLSKIDFLWSMAAQVDFYLKINMISVLQLTLLKFFGESLDMFYRVKRELKKSKIAIQIRRDAQRMLHRIKPYSQGNYMKYRKMVWDMYPLYHYPKAILRRVTGFFETKGD